MVGWLLCMDGRAVRCDVPDLGPTVALALGSDLLDYVTVAPGVDVWRDLTASVRGESLNAAAIGFVDQLLDMTAGTLPRIHGNAFICSHNEEGQPCGISPEGWRSLSEVFPAVAEEVATELS